MYRWEITRAAFAQRLFAVIRADGERRARELADTLLTAGLRTVEVSLTTPGALGAIAELNRDAGPDALVGAGTVLDAPSARMAVDAGARFLVSPALDADVIRTGHRYGVPVLPGVSTPTEAVRALELGADALKLFPASAHTPGWLRDVRSALPQAPFVPTGGVTPEQAPEWIAAGAVACGMGSSLARGDAREVAARVMELLDRLAAVRTPG